jgi:hypothetical protein
MDAKAPSSTAATLSGTQTLTNKTIDTASNTITGAVTLTGTQTLTNKTLTSPALTTPTISTATTNGDILYGTGSGALARLGIGSSATVLTVSGGIPSWATPASTAQNFTLLSTSSLSTGSVATFTVSSLSGYNQLLIFIDGASSTSANPVFSLRFNTDSTSKYMNNGQQFTTAPAVYGQIITNLNNTTSHILGTGDGSAGGYYMCQILVQGANSSGAKTTQITSSSSTTPTAYPLITQGIYTGTSVISSISLITTVGTFDSGTMYIYGAA